MSSEVSSSTGGGGCDDYSSNAEELEALYLMLEKNIIPELQWQNPGRRPPSPVGSSKVEQSATIENSETQEPTKNDFDFSDDVAQPQMRVHSQSSTPKSAKKKTANFACVMEVLKKKNAEST